MSLRTGTRASKTQDGEDVNVLIDPAKNILGKLTTNGSRIDISNDFEIDLGRLSHCEISHRDIHNRREISHCD